MLEPFLRWRFRLLSDDAGGDLSSVANDGAKHRSGGVGHSAFEATIDPLVGKQAFPSNGRWFPVGLAAFPAWQPTQHALATHELWGSS